MYSLIHLIITAIAAIWICVFFGARIRTGFTSGRIKRFLNSGLATRATSPGAFWRLVCFYAAVIGITLAVYGRNAYYYVADIFVRGPQQTEDIGSAIDTRLLMILAAANLPFLYLLGRLFFSDLKDFLELFKASLEPDSVSIGKGSRRSEDKLWARFTIWCFIIAYAGIVWVEYVILTHFIMYHVE